MTITSQIFMHDYVKDITGCSKSNRQIIKNNFFVIKINVTLLYPGFFFMFLDLEKKRLKKRLHIQYLDIRHFFIILCLSGNRY